MSADHLTQMLAERKAAHGDFKEQFTVAQRLKNALPELDRLDAVQREALEMILHKVSRIVTGNANYGDHWDDIAGYATLIANMLRPVGITPPSTPFMELAKAPVRTPFMPQPTGPRHCVEKEHYRYCRVCDLDDSAQCTSAICPGRTDRT